MIFIRFKSNPQSFPALSLSFSNFLTRTNKFGDSPKHTPGQPVQLAGHRGITAFNTFSLKQIPCVWNKKILYFLQWLEAEGREWVNTQVPRLAAHLQLSDWFITRERICRSLIWKTNKTKTSHRSLILQMILKSIIYFFLFFFFPLKNEKSK